ncbi:MAG: menaquinone biosynthesis protein [Deltaproteobacteria bacterium]|jgi:chorismate dehydratase|nr:menaquinone biosynthesis protein [Deltaproteobacteria bacterium]
MIRIGEINYLNVYPIYYYLKKALKKNNKINFMNFVSGSPAFLNRELETGNIDISPSSSFYYILNYKYSYIFPDLSISSKKKVKSIYLFSPKQVEDFYENETIYVTPETLTSINLLKVLLAEIYKMDLNKIKFTVLKPNDKLELKLDSFEDGAAIKEGIFLHIGNNALKLIKHIPKGYFAYDLADLWHRYTGYPFVFALFIINKDAYDKNKDEFDILYKFLVESKRTAVSGFREAALSISELDEYKFISYEELIDYWTECLSFDFGKNEIKGFNLYSELLYKNKLISSVPELNFV